MSEFCSLLFVWQKDTRPKCMLRLSVWPRWNHTWVSRRNCVFGTRCRARWKFPRPVRPYFSRWTSRRGSCTCDASPRPVYLLWRDCRRWALWAPSARRSVRSGWSAVCSVWSERTSAARQRKRLLRNTLPEPLGSPPPRHSIRSWNPISCSDFSHWNSSSHLETNRQEEAAEELQSFRSLLLLSTLQKRLNWTTFERRKTLLEITKELKHKQQASSCCINTFSKQKIHNFLEPKWSAKRAEKME